MIEPNLVREPKQTSKFTLIMIAIGLSIVLVGIAVQLAYKHPSPLNLDYDMWGWRTSGKIIYLFVGNVLLLSTFLINRRRKNERFIGVLIILFIDCLVMWLINAPL